MSEHYFTASPSSPEELTPVVVRAWGRELALQSVSGVFAAGRLDRGTAVLLRSARPEPTARTVLDLGCGYGAIACAVAAELPEADVWAVDVNERALRVCGSNAAALGLSARVHPVSPDGVPEGLEFDEIWSNPPIHIGKPALHDLLLRWLGRLSPEGRALLVVGRNLGADSLQRWLGDQGWRCDRLGSAKGFRVLRVTAATRQPS